VPAAFTLTRAVERSSRSSQRSSFMVGRQARDGRRVGRTSDAVGWGSPPGRANFMFHSMEGSDATFIRRECELTRPHRE
jgi:hypothetical protein